MCVNYVVMAVPSVPAVIEKIAGDVDQDDTISIADLVLMNNYLLGTQTFSEEQFKIADINNDTFVDVFDMTELRKLVISATIPLE